MDKLWEKVGAALGEHAKTNAAQGTLMLMATMHSAAAHWPYKFVFGARKIGPCGHGALGEDSFGW